MQFRAHNILLADGRKTRGDNMLLADTVFMQAIRTTIKKQLPQAENLKAVDLACLEGGFSVELARMGFDTLGIDARKENLINANFVKFTTGLNNLNFVLDDVRNLERYGTFDLVLCTGILYHLDQPAEFLKMLYRQTRHTLVLYSFYAPGFDLAYDVRSEITRLRKKLRPGRKKKNISEIYQEIGITADERSSTPSYASHIKGTKLGWLTRNEGYAGRWYREWDKDISREKVEGKIQTAYSNHRSFWFTKEELLRAVRDAGFRNVEEQTMPLGDFHEKYPEHFYGRSLLVAMK
ncbi:class I SAM-dependent methyltransferase [Sediminibacterium ginsengisoli]|uniref:Methyltransferase domain-containing protein n=1 Tax=Sediminibacterium ginsengisoli TaxID=413434 RepID=A0A1T4QB60_9BACT|nr:methyltransferase domain-containing protein [Sediminibacterium ginsengisoli]SKA00904.1 Methyltransferase domain-containing protein [Sediminibacterium ginsengisoli]